MLEKSKYARVDFELKQSEEQLAKQKEIRSVARIQLENDKVDQLKRNFDKAKQCVQINTINRLLRK